MCVHSIYVLVSYDNIYEIQLVSNSFGCIESTVQYSVIILLKTVDSYTGALYCWTVPVKHTL